MPILICLKEPAINLLFAGDIKDNKETIAEYDALFPNLMVTDQDGHNTVIPLSVECNIAFIKEITQEEINKRKKEMEERRKQAQRGGGGGLIQPAEVMFPRGGGRRTQ